MEIEKTMNVENSQILELTDWIFEQIIEGVVPLSSAQNLADEYLNSFYKNNDERVNDLINREATKNFASGFLTGFGSLWTLPVTIPTSLAVSYVIQGSLAGAIAVIYGHDLHDKRVKTLIILSIVGDSAKEILKQAGVKVSYSVTEKLISQIPAKLLIKINKIVGFYLISKVGEKALINLIKITPIVGGIFTGTVDAITCQMVGKTAQSLFRTNDL